MPVVDILIVDDHELVRAGMRRLLEDNPDIRSFTDAPTGELAISAMREQHFDIILMDLSLPGISGVETSLTMLREFPQARIVVITADTNGAHTRRLIANGVKGYLTKDSSPRDMRRAIESVLRGRVFIAPDIAQKIAINTINDDVDSPFERLTTREMEISLLLLNGNRNRQIGERLHISEKTVSTHRTRAFDKLGVSNTAQLARLALQHGVWNSLSP